MDKSPQTLSLFHPALTNTISTTAIFICIFNHRDFWDFWDTPYKVTSLSQRKSLHLH